MRVLSAVDKSDLVGGYDEGVFVDIRGKKVTFKKHTAQLFVEPYGLKIEMRANDLKNGICKFEYLPSSDLVARSKQVSKSIRQQLKFAVEQYFRIRLNSFKKTDFIRYDEVEQLILDYLPASDQD